MGVVATVFESEIAAQGDLLAHRAAAGAVSAAAAAAALEGSAYALAAARGSSDNAARFFQYLAGEELGLTVALAAPSLFEGRRTMGLDGAGVLAISQSGRTPGMVEVLDQGRAQGRPTVALTNDPGSPLAAAADVVVDLAVGEERAIASSKTFAATWHALAQLVGAMAARDLEGVDELPGLVGEAARWALGADLPLAPLDVEGGLTVVGRGVGYAVAAEAALKIREVAGLRAEAYAAADYLHGPIGADGHGATLLLCLTDELSDELAALVLADCARAGMGTVVVRGPERGALASDAEVALPLGAANWAAGLLEVVVGQVLALRLGERRGRPVDTSPGLTKVTSTA